MPWSLLAGAIPYLIAAAIGGRIAWGIQGARLDRAQAELEAAGLRLSACRAEADGWREVAAQQSAAVQEMEAAARRRAARAATEAARLRSEAEAAGRALAAWRAQGASGDSCEDAMERLRRAAAS